MEKIEPLPDHLQLRRFVPGQQVEFRGRLHTVVRRTTLASGEPAVVLQSEGEQFVVSAAKFLAGVRENNRGGAGAVHGKTSRNLGLLGL